MTNVRKNKLFDEMLTWIVDHCEDEETFRMALDGIGFTQTEINEITKDIWVE